MARPESRSDSFRTNMPRFCGGNFWRWRSMGLPRCLQQPIDRLNVSRVDVLGDVSLKNQFPRPLKSDTDLLLEPRQSHQVNGAPQHPPDNSGKVEREDPGNTGAPADRCKATHGAVVVRASRLEWPRSARLAGDVPTAGHGRDQSAQERLGRPQRGRH